MTMSIADRMAKAQQIKFMPATERDPESQRENSIKVDIIFLLSPEYKINFINICIAYTLLPLCCAPTSPQNPLYSQNLLGERITSFYR